MRRKTVPKRVRMNTFLEARSLGGFLASVPDLWFAKTLADFEINGIAALPSLFCYNS